MKVLTIKNWQKTLISKCTFRQETYKHFKFSKGSIVSVFWLLKLNKLSSFLLLKNISSFIMMRNVVLAFCRSTGSLFCLHSTKFLGIGRDRISRGNPGQNGFGIGTSWGKQYLISKIEQLQCYRQKLHQLSLFYAFWIKTSKKWFLLSF